jgi:hypothetical protein
MGRPRRRREKMGRAFATPPAATVAVRLAAIPQVCVDTATGNASSTSERRLVTELIETVDA